MESEPTHCIQSYNFEGFKMKGKFIENKIYNDQFLLLNMVSLFEDPMILDKMEFCEYKGFNAAKVTNKNGFWFWLTIEPWNGYQEDETFTQFMEESRRIIKESLNEKDQQGRFQLGYTIRIHSQQKKDLQIYRDTNDKNRPRCQIRRVAKKDF